MRGEERAGRGSGVTSDGRITTSPRAAHCPVEQDHQLLAERVGIIRAAVRADAGEPVAKSAFMPARDRSGEYDGLAPFADRVRKRATAKLFRSKPCLERSKDCKHAARRVGVLGLRTLEQRAPRAIAIAKVNPHERVLVRKVVVEGSARHAGFVRDGGEAHARETVCIKQPVGGSEDRGSRRALLPRSTTPLIGYSYVAPRAFLTRSLTYSPSSGVV